MDWGGVPIEAVRSRFVARSERAATDGETACEIGCRESLNSCSEDSSLSLQDVSSKGNESAESSQAAQ
jgi:hypothetical protein